MLQNLRSAQAMCVCCIDEACAACHWRSGLDQVVSALHHLPRWTHYLRLIPARKKGNTAVCFGGQILCNVVYGTCEAVVVPPHREFAGIRFWRNLLTAPIIRWGTDFALRASYLFATFSILSAECRWSEETGIGRVKMSTHWPAFVSSGA